MKKILLLIMVGLMLASSAYADTIAIDDFECGDMSCGEGWSSAWDYNGDVKIVSEDEPIDKFHMKFGIESKSNRFFDNAGYDNSMVTFYAKTFKLGERDKCNYLYNGKSFELLLVLGEKDTEYKQFSFDVTEYGLITEAEIVVSKEGEGGMCYIDNVEITGEKEDVRIDLFVKEYYPISERKVPIEMISSATNTLHILELRDNQSKIFCSKEVISPFVPQTTFLAYCDMLNFTQINSSATLFVAEKPEISVTKYFNITDPYQNENMLMIKKVYFSPQVLQGSSTEIFVVIEKSQNITIDTIYITLTFPDNTKRVLYMYETPNQNEYRAFITDTYQTGDIYFSVKVESKDYYDIYNNNYLVAAYNVDFVSLVNKVHSILTQPPGVDVIGTYYEVGDSAKVIAQLSEQGMPINNATCYVSIYYPDDTILARHEYMSYIFDSDGLYRYNLIAPNTVGVYPVSVACDYDTDDVQYNTLYIYYYHGVHLSGQITDLWYEDNNYSVMTGEINYTQNKTLLELDIYWYNVSSITPNSKYMVHWVGFTEIMDGDADVLWWNWNTSNWVASNETLDSELISQTFFDPGNNSNYRSVNGTVIIKLNGTAPITYIRQKVYKEDFEDNNISDWDLRCQPMPCNPSSVVLVDNNHQLNDTYSLLFQGNPSISVGGAIHSINITGYTDINISLTRKCVGSTLADQFYIMAKPGIECYQLFEAIYGNSPETRKTFSLVSVNNNETNMSIMFMHTSMVALSKCYIDDITITGKKVAAPIIHTDMITLRGIDIAGTINEVRGGGELNVKNKLTAMQSQIEEIYLALQNMDNTLTYSSPSIIKPNESAVISLRLTYSNIVKTYPELGAICSLTIWGPANTTGVGDILFSGENMSEIGSGTYYYNFTSPTAIGVYTVETNCEYSNRDYYGLTTLMVQDVGTDIWNTSTRNLTYYPPVTVNVTEIGNEVWGVNRTINVGLLGQIVYGIWDYVAKYTHGVII